MILGAFNRNAHGTAGKAVDEMTAKAVFYDHLAAVSLVSNPIFSLRRIVRNDVPSQRQCISSATADGGIAWLLLMTNHADSNDGAYGLTLSRHIWDRPLDIPGQWIAIQWNEERQTLRLATDRLGVAWLYIAEIEGGVAFASDFGALAAVCSKQLTIDPDTALLEYAVGYSPDHRTIFKEISMAPPGCILEWGPNGARVVASRSWAFGDRYENWSEDRKFRELDQLYDAVTERWFLPNKGGMTLSLSAGLDSRYALGLLDKHQLACPCFTFGNRESAEVVGAQSFAARAGRGSEVFSFDRAQWEAWQRSMRILGNAGTVQWVGWCEDWMAFIRRHASSLIIGYLGDALSGKHLGENVDDVTDWKERWIDWSIDTARLASPLRPESAERVDKVMRRRLESISSNVSTAYPFQLAMYFDLYGRQRRWVASQPNLLSYFTVPLTFFCDDGLIDFWSNLPLSDLDGQRLYRAYASDRFPKLFSGERKRDSTRLIARLGRALVRTGRQGFRARPPSSRPPVIDNRAIVVQNKAQILNLAEDAGFDFDAIFDMRAFIDLVRNFGRSGVEPQARSHQIVRITNLLLIRALAR